MLWFRFWSFSMMSVLLFDRQLWTPKCHKQRVNWTQPIQFKSTRNKEFTTSTFEDDSCQNYFCTVPYICISIERMGDPPLKWIRYTMSCLYAHFSMHQLFSFIYSNVWMKTLMQILIENLTLTADYQSHFHYSHGFNAKWETNVLKD